MGMSGNRWLEEQEGVRNEDSRAQDHTRATAPLFGLDEKAYRIGSDDASHREPHHDHDHDHDRNSHGATRHDLPSGDERVAHDEHDQGHDHAETHHDGGDGHHGHDVHDENDRRSDREGREHSHGPSSLHRSRRRHDADSSHHGTTHL